MKVIHVFNHTMTLNSIHFAGASGVTHELRIMSTNAVRKIIFRKSDCQADDII